MNPEIKARWVHALRSGRYKQGHRRLETSDGRFCCLGVLCKIAVEDGVIERKVHDGNVSFGKERTSDWERAILPRAVAAWADCTTVPEVDPPAAPLWPSNMQTDLTMLNDGWIDAQQGSKMPPLTFDQIADLIEEQL